MNSRLAILATVGVVIIIVVSGFAIGLMFFSTTSTETTSQMPTATSTQSSFSTTTSSSISNSKSTTTSITSSTSGVTIIVPEGTTYQVQSSYDCIAGHSTQQFNVTTTSQLEGGINATLPGVTVYVSTSQEAQTITSGHPAQWNYSSGLTNSTHFSILLSPGSYVLWIEGEDLGCGATIVTPLEELTFVTVTQAIMLTSTT